MKKIRRILWCIILSAIASFVITGCSSEGSSKQDEKKELTKKSVFFMYDKGSDEVYTFNEENEKVKTASSIENIKYSDELQSYIITDKDKGLYLLGNDGNKDKIGSDVIFDKVQTEGSQSIYFLTTDLDLYVKSNDGEKEKVASNVSDYYAFNGKDIIYTDMDSSLFLKKENEEKLKIASSVSDFRFESEMKYCAYVSEDSLYIKDIVNDDKEKVIDKNNGSSFEFLGDGTLVYFEDYNIGNGKGELYIKKYGGEKRKIASDVSAIKVYGDAIFYIDSDNTMYCRTYDDETKNKALDDVENMITTSDGSIYACDKDKNIYKISNGTDKEKFVQDYQSYKKGKSCLVVLDKDKNLYFGSVKIGSDVTAYEVNENDVAYINGSNEVYLSKNGSESEKVIGDAKEYEKIVFNDNLLFVNNLSPEDIKGYWKAEDPVTKENMYINFIDEYKIDSFGFDYFEETLSYVFENITPDVMTIKSDGEKIDVVKKDGNTISLRFDVGVVLDFHSITQDEYERMKNIASNVYSVAIQEFGADMVFFDSVQNMEGKTYYVYNTEEGDYGTSIYVDESGNKYVMRMSKLVPYGSFTDSNGNVFSEEMALGYAKDYCTNTYSQNNDIQFLVGDKNYEYGKAYFRIKLSSSAAIAQGGSGSMGWIKVFEDGTVYND